MGLKIYKPTTPGRRNASVVDYSELTKKEPEKSLIKILKKKAGRNSSGKITVRHRGGGSKRFYRIIDFKRDKFDIEAEVKALEYDPNRTAFIALVQYKDGEKRYILAPNNLKIGDKIISSKSKIEVKIGNAMPLKFIPAGTEIHNIELEQGKGGKIVRAAGTSAIIESVEGGYAQIKLPSGEIRLIPEDCIATIGSVSNPDNINVRLGKAGRTRHRGRRPKVRGKAMNAVDHPHGGGEGHTPIGLKAPKNIYGKKVFGIKTRRKKPSDKLILKRRTKKKKK